MNLIYAQQVEYLVVALNAARVDASAALGFKDSMNDIGKSNNRIFWYLEQVELIGSSGLGAIASVMKHLGKGRK